MAAIKISDLKPAGTDLFSDSENYLNEMSEQELNMIQGGIIPIIVSAAVVSFVIGRHFGRR